MAIDRDGIIWFGTESGLTRHDPEKNSWTSWTHEDGLGLDVGAPSPPPADTDGDESYGHHGSRAKSNLGPNPNYILDVAIDKHDVKWIGTWGAGLSRFDPAAPADVQWRTFSTADGLGGLFVHVLKFDEDGTLWVGSDGGVSTYANGRWTTYTTEQGLLDNNVFSLTFGDNGVVWVGTWRGLSKMERPRVASRDATFVLADRPRLRPAGDFQ